MEWNVKGKSGLASHVSFDYLRGDKNGFWKKMARQ